MAVCRWRAAALGGKLFALTFLPVSAMAQPGYYITPSFAISQVYNDNLFFTAENSQGDFITRLTPGIVAGYESSPLTLLGGYSFDGELFATRTELNEATARQNASMDFRYLPTRLLTLSFKGDYTETNSPGELNLLSGFPEGRVRADRFLVTPSIAYRFDPLTRGSWAYTFSKDDVAGGTGTDTHMSEILLERRFRPTDVASLNYVFRFFRFDGDRTTKSHGILPGWTHEFTPLTSFSVRVGPRVSDGSVTPEVLASIRKKLQQGDASLTYTRTETTVIGQTGTVTSDSVALAVKYRPWPLLELSGEPSLFSNRRATSESNVYRVRFGATYDMTKRVSLGLSYEFTFQNGILAGAPAAAGGRDRISSNIVMLSLVAKFHTRMPVSP